jgi:hypothetical protein
MSGYGLTGEEINAAMREKDRPQLDEWGLQGVDRQNKIIRDWTGEAQEESTSDSSACYQEGITDSEIYRTRREIEKTRRTIVRSLSRKGTAAWERRYRHQLRYPQEQVALLEALDCCIRDFGEERLRRERQTDPELDSRMYELAGQEHRLSQQEKQRENEKHGRARRKNRKQKRRQERANMAENDRPEMKREDRPAQAGPPNLEIFADIAGEKRTLTVHSDSTLREIADTLRNGGESELDKLRQPFPGRPRSTTLQQLGVEAGDTLRYNPKDQEAGESEGEDDSTEQKS